MLANDIFVFPRFDGDRDDKYQNYIISYPDLVASIAANIPGAGVTSVTLNGLNPLFTVANTGTVTNPIFTFTAPVQAANLVYAGPVLGLPATPTFRVLTLTDLPALPGSTLALCQLDFYVTNINSCSPLHINPTNGQDVYIGEAGGNVGIGTSAPLGKLGVVGTTGSGEKLISLYSSDWATPSEQERFYLTQGAFYARANTYDLHAAGGGDAVFTVYGNANGTIKIWSDAAGSDTFRVIGGNMPTISSLASGLMFTDASWNFGPTPVAPIGRLVVNHTTEGQFLLQDNGYLKNTGINGAYMEYDQNSGLLSTVSTTHTRTGFHTDNAGAFIEMVSGGGKSYFNTNTYTEWYANNTGILSARMDSVGQWGFLLNTGIGTLTPSARLTVVGATSFASQIVTSIQNSLSTAGMVLYDDGNLYLNSPMFTGFALQVGGANVLQYITYNPTTVSVRIPNNFRYNRAVDDFFIGGCDANNWYFQNASATQMTVSAKVHIQGETSDSTKYAFKVEDSTLNPLFSVRNDGVSTFTSAIEGEGTGTPMLIVESTGGGIRHNYVSASTYATQIQYYDGTDLNAKFYVGNGGVGILYTETYWLAQLSTGFKRLALNPSGDILIGDPANIYAQTARLHVLGSDATAANYGFKVGDNVNATLFSVRNDGLVDSKIGYYVDGVSGLRMSSGFSNIAVGNTAMPINIGYGNIGIGGQTLKLISAGASANVVIGYLSGESITSGSTNTLMGQAAGEFISTGSYNIGFGGAALSGVQTGVANIGIGYNTLSLNVAGNYNVAIGHNAMVNNTGSGSVALGFNAGFWETQSNTLFIDNAARIDQADGRIKALIYGIFDAQPYLQRLTINGLTRIHNFTVADMALSSPLNGDITYVTDTDGTFTSKGFWGYEEGAWVKL